MGVDGSGDFDAFLLSLLVCLDLFVGEAGGLSVRSIVTIGFLFFGFGDAGGLSVRSIVSIGGFVRFLSFFEDEL